MGSNLFNHKIARLKVLRAIREGHNTDEALERRYMPDDTLYKPVEKQLRKQLGQVLSELEAEGVIERELSHGVWIMKEERERE